MIFLIERGQVLRNGKWIGDTKPDLLPAFPYSNSMGRAEGPFSKKFFSKKLCSTGSGTPWSSRYKDQSEYGIGVVATFISELMLEEEERKISEEEMFDLTTSIQDYISSNPANPHLDSFIKTLPDDFPRRKLLQRFSSKGLFKHLFSSTDAAVRGNNNRINYYNFESIDLASNRSAARAIMAAIMADFNFQLANKRTEEELIFLSDETPFFIEQCFRSFKLLNKNVRKLNGSLILTVQVSTDLIIDEDESLIANSDTKFLLSYDTTKEAFSKRFQLTPDEAEIMWTISPEKGQYSQFLLKDKNGARVGHLILTPK